MKLRITFHQKTSNTPRKERLLILNLVMFSPTLNKQIARAICSLFYCALNERRSQGFGETEQHLLVQAPCAGAFVLCPNWLVKLTPL